MDDWISAADALAALPGPATYGHGNVILTRAYDGMIGAKATRLACGEKREDDVLIDPSFWRDARGAHLRKDWQNGDFETTIYRGHPQSGRWLSRTQPYVEVRASGVMFRRADVSIIAPSLVVEFDDEADLNPVSQSQLTAFYEGFAAVNPKFADNQTVVEKAAKAYFPDRTITRIRVRSLCRDAKRGRPKSP